MNQAIAQRSGGDFEVVHAIPGRVRLRMKDNRLLSSLETVAQQLQQHDSISEVRTNPTSNSLIVLFDATTVSLSQMIEKLQEIRITEVSGKRKQLQEVQASTFLPQTEGLWSSPDSLVQNGEQVAKSIVPIAAGMLATTALGVEGILAFPVYLIAANVTREVLKQFTLQPQDLNLVQPSQKSTAADSDTNPTTSPSEIAYTVVHEVPGRIRFRIPRIAEDGDYTQKLTGVMEADGRVTHVRINTAASSIAVSYNLGESLDEQMRIQRMNEVRSHLIHLIQTAPNTTISLPKKNTSNQEESEPETNLLSQMAFPALSATLALMGGPLGLPIPPLIIGGSIAISTLPIVKRTLDSLVEEKRLTIDFLDLTAITITTLQGHFISPAIMIVLVEIGEAIREQTAKSSKKQTLDLLDSLEQFVWVERNGEKQQISIQEVKRGDIVIVYPGDQIPVDGQIVRGKALIDEQKLTGESMPVMRKKGQSVYTSTLIREGQLYILAEQIGADTRAGQIIKVMQDAPVHDTRIENYAANIANQAVVPTLILSGIVFGLTGNFARAASILTLDFATGIRVSVPTTVLAALTYAARRGILIRSGRALEKLAQVDAVVFDKTGTLTRGEAVIVKVDTESDSISPMQVLEIAAAAEQRLTHPVAEAVVRYAQEQGANIPAREKWEYEIGQGVRAKIDGRFVLVGSEHFLRQEGVYLNGQPKKHSRQSYSVIYVASDGELQGAIAYRDPLRPESQRVIKALRATGGMEIYLLTGDNQRTAQAVAAELGIEEACTHAEAFPEQKVAVVKELHELGKTVAFVGDGINDSPALAYADVSVSFANGSDVARETADVVLMDNNLRGLPEAIAIARQAMQLIHQNTAIVAVPNLAALALAVTLGIDPLSATLVNNGTTVIAGLNGLRPLLANSDEEPDWEAETVEINRQEQDSQTLPIEIPVESPVARTPEESVVSVNGNGSNGHSHGLQSLKDLEANTFYSPNGTTAVTLTHTPASSSETVASAVSVIELSRSDRLSLVTESHTSSNGNGAKHQLVLKDSQPLTSEPLTGAALAQRLQVSDTTISRRKSKADFSEWTRRKDPDGVAWTYSKKSKLFLAS